MKNSMYVRTILFHYEYMCLGKCWNGHNAQVCYVIDLNSFMGMTFTNTKEEVFRNDAAKSLISEQV